MTYDDDNIMWDQEEAPDIGLFYDGDSDDDETSIVPLCRDCQVDWGIYRMVDMFQSSVPYRCVACERPNRAEVNYEERRRRR
jgi:hypothetical protein